VKGKAKLKHSHFRWHPETIEEFKIHGQYKKELEVLQFVAILLLIVN